MRTANLALQRAIDRLGGDEALADELGVERDEVRRWAASGIVPNGVLEQLEDMACGCGSRKIRAEPRPDEDLARLLGCTAQWVRQRADTGRPVSGYLIRSHDTSGGRYYSATIEIEESSPSRPRRPNTIEPMSRGDIANRIGVTGGAIREGHVGDYIVTAHPVTPEQRAEMRLRAGTKYLWSARRFEPSDEPESMVEVVGEEWQSSKAIAEKLEVTCSAVAGAADRGHRLKDYRVQRRELTEKERVRLGMTHRNRWLYRLVEDGD